MVSIVADVMQSIMKPVLLLDEHVTQKIKPTTGKWFGYQVEQIENQGQGHKAWVISI